MKITKKELRNIILNEARKALNEERLKSEKLISFLNQHGGVDRERTEHGESAMMPYITDDDIVNIFDSYDSYLNYTRINFKKDVWAITAKDGYVLGFVPNNYERNKVALKHSDSRHDKNISDDYNYHNGEARAIRMTKLFGDKVWPERMQKANDMHNKNMSNFRDKEHKADNFNESNTQKITKSQLKEMILKETQKVLNEISPEFLAKKAGRAYHKKGK